LDQLNSVGKWLGGHRASLNALKRVPQPIESILDVGCGGGHMTLLMGHEYPQAKVVGIELNPSAIEYAKGNQKKQPSPSPNVTFQWRRQAELLGSPKSYDVVISSLVCHHMEDAELIDFLKKACTVAKKRVIVNDLHRHPIALWTFQALTPIF